MSKFPMVDRCDEKAKTQPHFTLLAQDNFTVCLLRQWIVLAEGAACIGKAPVEKIAEAKRLLAEIEQWREANPDKCKIPD